MSEDGYFVITRLHREDIKTVFPDNEKDIDNLTDGQMKYLARKMSDDYLEQLYWGSLEILAKVSAYRSMFSSIVCANPTARF